MRLKTIQLVKFKRFDDLTIDLGDSPKKVVALVGPNGCGKSSVFDAFEEVLQNYVGVSAGNREPSFYGKRFFDVENPVQQYNRAEAIKIIPTDDSAAFGPKSFYVRSAYRYTSALKITSIKETSDPITDTNRPGSSVQIDQRLQVNYERMLARLLTAFWEAGVTGETVRAELVGALNQRLARVLDIQITDIGNVAAGRGQLFFEKGGSKDFPFENLSAGEKEVVDLLIDLVVKTPTFDDTVYAIDEPELHLNTAIQRRLLKELADLIPDSCQLWVATHSIGFLRALQQDFTNEAQILDFSEKDYFTGNHTINPIVTTRGTGSGSSAQRLRI